MLYHRYSSIWIGNGKNYMKHLCYAIPDIIRILSVYLEAQ